mmetsp:Transcript_10260/g.20631  ORF Transcript_10260/g.20631 Transcript_10260/m.20631 type:complete len:133 (-) Transcript_10260:512-910(-)
MGSIPSSGDDQLGSSSTLSPPSPPRARKYQFAAKLQFNSDIKLMCPLEIEHECDVFDRFGSDRFLYVQVDLNMVKVSKSMYHFCYFRSLLDNIWIASRQWKVLAEVADNAFVLFAMKGVGIEDSETAPFREV